MIIQDHHIFALGEGRDKAQEVPVRMPVTFVTCDCFFNQIQREDDALDRLDWSRINPATGPVVIREARAGDVLKLSIKGIEVTGDGTMCAMPGAGVLGDQLGEVSIKRLPIRDGFAHFNDLRLPLDPMIGVIGLAPKGEPVSCGAPGSHGGNMDSRILRQGTTLYLPVFHDGAFFAVGDVHALMGDGEIMVTGVEVPARVVLVFDVIKGQSIAHPMAEDAAFVYTLASHEDLMTAITLATDSMNQVIRRQLGLSLSEAGMLQSAVGDVQISQVVDPLLTARFAMPKAYLKKLFD